ncbi:MAG: c-type cytochrome [Fuerstiella sp.]
MKSRFWPPSCGIVWIVACALTASASTGSVVNGGQLVGIMNAEAMPAGQANTDEVSPDPLSLLADTLSRVQDPSVRAAVMTGMLRGLEGRRNVPAPTNWKAVAAKLRDDPNSSPRVIDLVNQLSQLFGDDGAIQQALQTIANVNADANFRRRMLSDLLAQQNSDAAAMLEQLLDDSELQLTAIRGFSVVENAAAPSILLSRYRQMSSLHRKAALETLASRKLYAESLLTALRSKQVERDDVPVHVARALGDLLGDRFVTEFGPVPNLAVDREKQIAKWKSIVTAKVLAKANPINGRKVFQKTCATCHLLYGEGAKIGPDLTGSNRANLDYLLLNSVDPSYDVPTAYQLVTIVTIDGRTVNGIVAEEDSVRIVLKTIEDPRIVIAKSDIDERIVSKKSMMPDGQLDALKLQQVVDLIKYLQTSEQVELVQ